MLRTTSVLVIVVLCFLLSGCASGGSGYTPAVIPGISGQWELLASSTTDVGQQTFIEANLQEGQGIAGGMFVPNGQLSAAGNQQIAILTVDSAGNVSFNGGCPGTGVSGLSGTVDQNYNVKINYSENGNNFAATGTLSSDHKTILGTYTSQTGSGCLDSGTLMATAVPKVSGSFVGQLCPPANVTCVYPLDATDNATAAVSQSGASLKANFTLTGTDNTGFSMSGTVTGNAFTLQGAFQGQIITYSGYYELTFDCLTQQIDLPSIYLVNQNSIGVGNPFGQVALLTMPLTQACPGSRVVSR